MALFDRFLGRPSRNRFARLLADGLKQAGDDRETVYEPGEFRLVFYEDGKVVGVANLRNLYDEYCGAPQSERPNRLRNCIRSILSWRKEIPEEFEDVRPDLRPIIRARSFLELLRIEQEIESPDGLGIPHQPVGDHLIACLAWDLPESIRTITQHDLDKWGVSFYEAMEAARQSLEEVEFAFAGIGESLYASLTGDSYDASRLFLFDLIRSLPVQGEHIAIVPNRDTLLLTGSDDPEGLTMMADLAETALEDPRPINVIPLRLDGDEWVSWTPEPDHPLYEKIHLLTMRSVGQEYADQKARLDALHQKNGTDIFVASFSAVEKDGEVITYCVWSAGVDSLLPRTQKVMFVGGLKSVAAGDWDRVQEVVGDLMVPVENLYPIRYRVREFPSPEQLEAIGSEL
jgi:hypothetical protein